MTYAVEVLMDCPVCGDEVQVTVQYGGRPSRHPYADSAEIVAVDVECPSACTLNSEQRSVLEEEAVAIAQQSSIHTEVFG